MSKSKKKPSLPKLLHNKIYKTGQTRGADDDLIYQNRVIRNSTVLIPYSYYEACKVAPDNEGIFENSFIVLINPEFYFSTKQVDKILKKQGLRLGINTLIFYYSREQWNEFNPLKYKLESANSRKSPLGGQYVARVPATTAAKGSEKIRHGFTTSKLKGAGIRVYEYASTEIIKKCRLQLEYIFWKCLDAYKVVIDQGMTKKQAKERANYIIQLAKSSSLADENLLKNSRIIDLNGNTVCPLCLEKISAVGFFNKVKQAKGREVSDLTITQLNLFHIKELRIGQFNHKPYNLAWGHHHCNIVVKDSGINETLIWMNQVVEKNRKYGFKF